MLRFQKIYSAKSEVKNLTEFSPQMLLAVKSFDQTFVRLVLPDGSARILFMLDRMADLVNGSISEDIRLLHLTERVERDGDLLYVSRVYDIAEPPRCSEESKSHTVIQGVFMRSEKGYTMLHFVGEKLTEVTIGFESNRLVLRKKRNGINALSVMWFRYLYQENVVSTVTKSYNHYYFTHDYANSDDFKIKLVGIAHQHYGYRMFTCMFKETYCFVQQVFFNDKENCHFLIQTYPSKHKELLEVPLVSAEIPLCFHQIGSLVFIFVPNRFVCIFDIKEKKRVFLKKAFAQMGSSLNVCTFDNGYLCDRLKGSIMEVVLDLTVFGTGLLKKNAVSALALLAARVQRARYYSFERKAETRKERTVERVVSKKVMATIFSILKSPTNIVDFFKEFMHFHRKGTVDIALYPFHKFMMEEPTFYLGSTEQFKSQLKRINADFPSNGPISRLQMFTICVQSLMEQNFASSIPDAMKKAHDISVSKNVLVQDIRDAWNVWKPESEFERFLIGFALTSEFGFINYPKVPRMESDIGVMIDKFFLPEAKTMFFSYGIYGQGFCDLDTKTIEFVISRINPKTLAKNKKKEVISVKTQTYHRIPKRV